MTKIISSESISDKETVDTLQDVFHAYHYLLDPHSAVAYKALANHLQQHQAQKGILLGTAHPIKFPDVVKKAIGNTPETPLSVQNLWEREKKSIILPPDFQLFKKNLENFLKIS
jgi:threonine synthase